MHTIARTLGKDKLRVKGGRLVSTEAPANNRDNNEESEQNPPSNRQSAPHSSQNEAKTNSDRNRKQGQNSDGTFRRTFRNSQQQGGRR